jgi:6-phosphogluconolactonase
MKLAITLIAVLLFTNCKNEKKPVMATVAHKNTNTFYVGTYTDKESKGIYKYAINNEGMLTEIGLVATTDNPSFLALSNDKKYLLAVNEVNKDSIGFVSSYRIKNDSLEFINKSSSGGAHPCFIAVNKQGYVLSANYTGGNVGLLKLNKNGELSPLLDLNQHEGKGTTDRQEGPHAHSAWFEPEDDASVISVDLGTNELWFSKIDENSDKFIASEPQKLAMATGAGPRHLTFHPNKKYLYVLNELDNTISLVQKSETGDYQIKQTITTLPENFTEFSKSADIHISSDGKFVYSSNRGHDSIAIFAVNATNGNLTLLAFESTKGKTPRNFSLSNDENYVIVANQDSNNLVSFKRNNTTGLLTYISEIKAPTPVCIVFN